MLAFVAACDGQSRCSTTGGTRFDAPPAGSCRYESGVLLCADVDGAYVMQGTCDMSCNLEIEESTLRCPCHSTARWTLNGAPLEPDAGPLAHYAACVERDGSLWTDAMRVVAAEERF